MPRYVMLVTNNDGGSSARIFNTLDAIKQAIRNHLTDPGNEPPITDDERGQMERDLADLTGEGVESVRGSDAWKEWVYVAPLAEE